MPSPSAWKTIKIHWKYPRSSVILCWHLYDPLFWIYSLLSITEQSNRSLKNKLDCCFLRSIFSWWVKDDLSWWFGVIERSEEEFCTVFEDDSVRIFDKFSTHNFTFFINLSSVPSRTSPIVFQSFVYWISYSPLSRQNRFPWISLSSKSNLFFFNIPIGISESFIERLEDNESNVSLEWERAISDGRFSSIP